MTHFFRLLPTPIPAKGQALAAQIAALNTGQPAPDSFAVEPTEFRQIPGSPFAYWASAKLLSLFASLPKLEQDGRVARLGDHPDDQARYLRLFWEIAPDAKIEMRQWLPYQKGGAYSPYYADIHLLVDWDSKRETYFGFYGRPGRASEHPSNYQFFLRLGLTWPRRTTSGISIRTLPTKSIFADKGPAVFLPYDSQPELLKLLAIMNSAIFPRLVELQLGAADVAARSYEVGIIQQTPIPPLEAAPNKLSLVALEAHNITRDHDRTTEITHVFCLPALAHHRDQSLQAAITLSESETASARTRLAAIQQEIDEIVAGLYGLEAKDFSVGHASSVTYEAADAPLSIEAEADEDEADESETTSDLPAHVQALLQWCVGCAFGRWDVRFALDPTLLPQLQGPFDPLPRCSPGMLLGPDGLPAQKDGLVSEAWLRARPDVNTLPPSPLQGEGPGMRVEATIPDSLYPLRVDWDGLMPDDPDHRDDIVRRVRDVLELLWGERAEAIEQEACAILGVADLRAYFRHPKAFFDFHIKRYSKSRRKAPIYWLLQSAKKNYGVWLYYPRHDPDTLFKGLTLYADPKLKLERIRLSDLRGQLAEAASARDRRATEKAITRQEALIAELTAFRNTLERVARLGLPPDFNDGVIISIAPLHPLVPWKEAEKMWDELTAGRCGWSSMSQRLRAKGLVRGGGD